uniref:Uncharacterized protein n=1 Tax=Anguilla anguilla TaxID=7936 RepID=A0A0E9PCK1_ANGAN
MEILAPARTTATSYATQFPVALKTSACQSSEEFYSSNKTSQTTHHRALRLVHRQNQS